MAKDDNAKVQEYLNETVYADASKDLTTNIIRRLKQLTGDMTARFKAIISSAGTSN